MLGKKEEQVDIVRQHYVLDTSQDIAVLLLLR